VLTALHAGRATGNGWRGGRDRSRSALLWGPSPWSLRWPGARPAPAGLRTRRLRISPLRASAYFQAKVLTAYAMAFLTIGLLYLSRVAYQRDTSRV